MAKVTLQATQPIDQYIHLGSMLWSLGLFVLAIYHLIPLDSPVTWSVDWLGALNIAFSFYIDGLSRLFILLITGIGALIFAFSGHYLAGHPHRHRFFLYLHLFMLAMLGVVTADNLLTLFIFWELTSFTSYLLIGFNHDAARSRRAALQGLLVTGAGGLCLLAGVILLAQITGSFALSEILSGDLVIHEHPLITAVIVLIGLGALTKSAQFPFHFWLPNAMEAPTPVSAFLHSATMVKAGIYLLARLHPVLSEAALWMPLLAITGSITAVLGGVLALKQRDLKQTLAYTTLMALGTLTALLSQPGTAAVAAASIFLVAHALYKATLFLSVGAIDHTLGAKRFSTLFGLWQRDRLFAFAWLAAALSLAGLPPALGFISKEMLYDSLLQTSGTSIWVLCALLLANAMMVALAFSMSVRILRPSPTAVRTKFAFFETGGPILMALLGLWLAIAPKALDQAMRTLLATWGDTAASEIIPLGLWHGINPALGLSLVTLSLGLLIGRFHARLYRRLHRLPMVSFDRGWDHFLATFVRFAESLTDMIQTNRLSRDLCWVLGTLTGLALLIAWNAPAWPHWEWGPAPLKLWLIVILILAGTMFSLIAQSRIAAITGLGVVGIGVALIFILFGAPDVAITQLLVETLLVVLIAVALLNLPTLPKQTGIRWGHATLALATGFVISGTLWGITTQPLDRTLTSFFEQSSWTEAYGRNIVNVILVDFRALDTFGEIAVVLTAAIGAIALLKDMRMRKR